MADINVTDGTVLESLNNKIDIDGGNYVGSPIESIINTKLDEVSNIANSKLSATTGGNGYIRFSNGLIIQWGYIGISGDPQTVTTSLPTAFSNTNYRVCVTATGMNDWWNEWGLGTLSKSTTNFSVYAKTKNKPLEWIAIGY